LLSVPGEITVAVCISQLNFVVYEIRVLMTTTEKFATFEPRSAQFVRLMVVDSTKGKNFVAIADINIYAVNAIPSSVNNGGKWGLTLNFPLVPVTAFLNPTTRNLITMSADQPSNFKLDPPERERKTVSATWDPKKGTIEEQILDATGHDMFCPGTSFDESGKVIFTGGSTPLAFSIYDPVANSWSTPENKTTHRPMTLQIGRGYQGQTFLFNGKTFMIGGRWSGNKDKGFERDGELYDPATGWKVLHNVKASIINMNVSRSCKEPEDGTGCTVDEWQQHHPWLFAWKKDSIFHAGPSQKMNWIFTTPTEGEVKDGGFRIDKNTSFADGDAVCGITSMYDAEKGVILTAGGAPNYHYWFKRENNGANDKHRLEATTNAFEIELGDVEPGTVVKPRKVASMKYKRIFANAVILPTGETFVVGGQSQGEPFVDDTWQPVPEIYSPDAPDAQKWREVARHSTPRVYHSWALLLPDATVIVGGGGLDRQETDHYDAQIYQPAYLFGPDGKTAVERPKINTIDKKLYKIGDKIVITTNVAVDGASLIRYSATTHSLNNDMRRIKLAVTPEGNASDKKYSMKIPNDSGVTLPGYWMLFVLQKGVPSHAATVQILA
jgi:galactose oxidase